MLYIYKFHTNPEQLDGYENRLRVPQFAYKYGEENGFTDELVSVVAKDPWTASDYAQYVIKGRWPEGEAAIAKDPEWAGGYEREFGVQL